MTTLNSYTRTHDINGTHLQGYIEATFDELVKAFGTPCRHDPATEHEKVTIEWCLKSPDGIVATVYDWKGYGYQPSPHETYHWHIGGYNSRAVTMVHNAVKIKYAYLD